MDKITPFPNKALIEEEASKWIVKFDGEEEPTEEDVQAFNAWIRQNPLHKQVLLQMANTWSELDIMSSLKVPLGQSEQPKRQKFRLWSVAPILMIASALTSLARQTQRFIRSQLALPALVLVAALVLTYDIMNTAPPTPDNLYVTTIGQQSTHLLDDGSTLWLNSNSKVEVLFTETKRLVSLLEGEAHFNVEHDPDRPFEVYAGNRMVKAVGTAFSVYRLDDRVEVMVTEGKVDLSVVESTLVIFPQSGLPENSLTERNLPENRLRSVTVDLHKQAGANASAVKLLASLEAGQSVAIPVKTVELATPVVEHQPGEVARKMSWLEGRLVFAGESLEEVVAEVSRHTPVVIEVTDPNLKKLRIGGQFHAGETEALFDVLESGFGVKINRITDNHVLLQAK